MIHRRFRIPFEGARASLLCVTVALAACGSKTALREWDAAVNDAADVPDVPQPDVPQPNNVGREYWTVPTANSQLGSLPAPGGDMTAVGVDGFPFAIAVANPSRTVANVRVTGGELTAPRIQAIDPGALKIIELPWVQRIAQVTQRGATERRAVRSAFAAGAGYHIESDVAVAVYQFNPLSYQDVRRQLCNSMNMNDIDCFTFTNDSSLLLPVDVLTGNYTVVAWPSSGRDYGSFLEDRGGGFATVVATQDNTHVTVRLTGGVRQGDDVAAAPAHSVITRTMNAGDVWELVSEQMTSDRCVSDPDPICADQSTDAVCGCQPYPEVDLTGSRIESDAPVAVFAGHDCANVPYDRYACDHLEEQLFPSETLGNHYVVTHTVEQLPQGEPNVIRIVSDRNDNTVTFSPTSIHAPVTLQQGQWVEFEHRDHFEVRGTQPLIVAQYLVGQGYFSRSPMSVDGMSGDPSMSLEVPEEQWRTSYDFLSPATYPLQYVNIVAPHGARLLLDGHAVSSFPGSVGAYDVYRENISDHPGPHHLESSNGMAFGIKAYGFGSYTSYMNPGGLDLRQISP